MPGSHLLSRRVYTWKGMKFLSIENKYRVVVIKIVYGISITHQLHNQYLNNRLIVSFWWRGWEPDWTQ